MKPNISELSAWDQFPFKYHPEVLSDSDESSDDDDVDFEELMKKYKTESLSSDSDETTDDSDETTDDSEETTDDDEQTKDGDKTEDEGT